MDTLSLPCISLNISDPRHQD